MGQWLLVLVATLSLTAPCVEQACLDDETLTPPGGNLLEESTRVLEGPENLSGYEALPAGIPLLAPVEEVLSEELPSNASPLRLDPSSKAPQTTEDPPVMSPPESSQRVSPTAPIATGLAMPEQAHRYHEQRALAQGDPIEEAEPNRVVTVALASLAAIGLYHRLTKRTLLEHETRRRVLDLLDEAGTLSTAQLAERLGVSYRTARHHASKLEAFGLVSCVNDRGPERWALPGHVSQTPAPLDPARGRILRLVAREAGIHLSEVARRLDIAKATAKHRLDALHERGLVQDETTGPLRRFFVTNRGLDRLEGEDQPSTKRSIVKRDRSSVVD